MTNHGTPQTPELGELLRSADVVRRAVAAADGRGLEVATVDVAARAAELELAGEDTFRTEKALVDLAVAAVWELTELRREHGQ